MNKETWIKCILRAALLGLTALWLVLSVPYAQTASAADAALTAGTSATATTTATAATTATSVAAEPATTATAATTAAEPATTATAASSSQTSVTSQRLSVSAARMWLNGAGQLKVTLDGHTDGEELTVTAKAPKAVTIAVSEWEGDNCTITLTPRKTKNTYLYISYGEETVRVRLFMTKEAVLTGEQVYARSFDAMVEIRTVDSVGQEYVGAGFFIGDRMILTNHHVVSEASKIEIFDYYGRQYTIKSVLGFDADADLLVFKVKEANTSALTLAGSVTGGETAYSIGSPVGLTGTFVRGIVANPSQIMYDTQEILDEVTGETCTQKVLKHYVQVSIATGTGCGGGPVINSHGQVIGISTLTITSAQNISLAVGYDGIAQFLDSLDGTGTMSLKAFCALNPDGVKESNLYEFSVQGSIDDFADRYDDSASGSTGSGSTAAAGTGHTGTTSGSTGNVGTAAGTGVLTAEEVYALAHDAMVEIWVRKDGEAVFYGSGFFVSDYAVVTCNHVVKDYEIAYVKDYNGYIYELTEGVKTSSDYDIALLSVWCKDRTATHSSLRVDATYIPYVGETVYAFGSPAGETCTLSEGVISMSRRTLMGITGIQFDAAITSGSSGGALINQYGDVIGITYATVLVSEHNNFAVPVRYIGMVR